MNRGRRLALANSVALLGPSALLGGALWFQYFGGLPPCEMCLWQRWPHLAAILLGLLALAVRRSPARLPLLALAGFAILISAGLGLFHAGVEQRWWEGLTRCSTMGGLGTGADFLRNVMAQPLVRCDAIPWSLFGVSLAGWNAILSGVLGSWVLWLTAKR